MGWFSGGSDNDSDSDRGAFEAAKDSAKESPMEKAYCDYKAAEGANSLGESIFGK